MDVLNGGGWVCVYSPHHNYSRWTESSSFLSTCAPESLVHTRHDTVHCPVPATSADCWVCISRPLDPPALVAHRTVFCDLTPLSYSRPSDVCSRGGSRLLVKFIVGRGLTRQCGELWPRSAEFFPRAACSWGALA